MSFEATRVALFTLVQAGVAAAGITDPIEFENVDLIDHSTRQGAFITVMLGYRDARQASIEDVPQTRYDGELRFHIHVPQGEGSKRAADLMDKIEGFVKYKRVGNIQLLEPRPFEPKPVKGYSITPFFFRFHLTE